MSYLQLDAVEAEYGKVNWNVSRKSIVRIFIPNFDSQSSSTPHYSLTLEFPVRRPAALRMYCARFWPAPKRHITSQRLQQRCGSAQ
jgi:hypothetical protein